MPLQSGAIHAALAHREGQTTHYVAIRIEGAGAILLHPEDARELAKDLAELADLAATKAAQAQP